MTSSLMLAGRRLVGHACCISAARAGAAWLALLSACGGSARSTDADPGAAGTEVTEAFAELAVRIDLNELDTADLDARDPETGTFPPEPPLRRSVSLRVEVNGGTSAGRVPGLRVLADGVELPEIGSSGIPQRFSYLHEPPEPGRALTLTLRHEGAAFSLVVEPLAVELIYPAADDVLAPAAELMPRWSGIERAPEPASIVPRSAGCDLAFEPSPGAALTFMPRGDTPDPTLDVPCRFELTAEWRDDGVVPPSPFRALTLERVARRIQRFEVRSSNLR